MRPGRNTAKSIPIEDIGLKNNNIREIEMASDIDMKSSQLNLIQSLLMVATGVMLLPTIAIIMTTSRSPENLFNAISILLQILTVCAVLVACILLSKIEAKFKVGGK